MFGGTGFILELGAAAPGPDSDQQWKYVIYGGLAVAIGVVVLWMVTRWLSATRGESTANEARARVLLQRMADERNLRTTTHWRTRPNGMMMWEVEVIDDHSGERWLTYHRKLLEATHEMAAKIEFKID